MTSSKILRLVGLVLLSTSAMISPVTAQQSRPPHGRDVHSKSRAIAILVNEDLLERS
jgi:hypothetical protein